MERKKKIPDLFKKTPSKGTSGLSAIRDTKQVSTPPRDGNVKKRGDTLSGKATKAKKDEFVEDILIDDDSDGESPVPSNVRKDLKANKKRKSVYISSDSESSTHKTPEKPRSKKICLESESGSSKKKDEEEEMETDSEDEFVEKKKPKKTKNSLLPGQTKLNFGKAAATTKTKETEKTKEKPINASDFFSKNKSSTLSKTLPSTLEKKEEPKKRAPSPPKVLEKKKREKVISPSQKENLKAKEVVIDDNEFVSSDDDIVEIQQKSSPKKKSPKKAEKTPVKKVEKSKEVSPKKIVPEKKALEKKIPPKVSEYKPPPPKVEDKALEANRPWVDKYKPKTFSQLVGQHGDRSPLNKLLGWLRDWAKHNLGEGAKIKKAKPPPFRAHEDGTPFKAALLSGTPGIGKTTCAQLACENLGFKFVEMNASDVRNKKHMEAQVAQLIGSHQIEEYFSSSASSTSIDDLKVHHVLIMDEVDGMSGNEDRAGIAELIQMIKDTKIPVICICNDRAHPKIRSLSNHCFDIRFPKPRVETIRSRMMTIACQEKLKISKEDLDELIEMSNHDVRQVIYNLQMRAANGSSSIQKKDCAINTFEAARKLLDSRSTLFEKQDMFFTDYSIMPLFVQENYINMRNDEHTKLQASAALRKAADLISCGDLVDGCLRSTGAWKLLNEQGMIGCVLPSIAIDGRLRAQIQFPSWLGKNSSSNKRQRLARQLASHAHLKISANMQGMVTDYIPVLHSCLTRPLLFKENEGVREVVDLMNEYDLMRDDLDAIGELAIWPGKIDPSVKIQSKVKSALTRTLNKEKRMLPYAVEEIAKGKKKKGSAVDAELELDEEGNLVERKLGEDEEDEEEDDKDDLPVVKVTTSSSSARGGRGRGSASSSRGSRGSRGRGRGGA